jgi:two-component system, OmpR family, osmolarity sensor histidine kinase EnvZ
VTSPGSVRAAVRALPLRRAVSNLIDNALRYAENSPIDIRLWQEASQAFIEVADRGPGIPPSEVERVRRPFTRLEAARSDTKGAGLGLAIIDRIMRSHDGRLDLLPRDGGGLRAVLSLPLKASAQRKRDKMLTDPPSQLV